MKMISPTPLDSVLEFANIEGEIDSNEQVDGIFRRHGTGPVWRRLEPKDLTGYQAFILMRDKVRDWLDTLIRGSVAKKRKVVREIVDTIPNASEPVRYVDQGGQPTGMEYRLIGIPRLATDSKGNLAVYVEPVISGVHAVVLHAMLEIYDKKFKIGRCPVCRNYYKRSPKLRVTCSAECKRARRIKKVYRNLKRWRSKQRKGRL